MLSCFTTIMHLLGKMETKQPLRDVQNVSNKPVMAPPAKPDAKQGTEKGKAK